MWNLWRCEGKRGKAGRGKGEGKGEGKEEGRRVGLSRRCGRDEKTEDVERDLGGQPKFAWRVGQHFVLLFRMRIYMLMRVINIATQNYPESTSKELSC